MAHVTASFPELAERPRASYTLGRLGQSGRRNLTLQWQVPWPPGPEPLGSPVPGLRAWLARGLRPSRSLALRQGEPEPCFKHPVMGLLPRTPSLHHARCHGRCSGVPTSWGHNAITWGVAR